MKKYFLLIAIAIATGFTSCDVYTDEEAGGTSVEKMAGTWTVTFEQSYAEYQYLIEGTGADPQLTSMTPEQLDQQEWVDAYGVGKVTVMTSNTAANVDTEMWFVDNSFWGTQVRCSVDYPNRTFECTDQTPLNYDGDCIVNIIGGKVLEGAATTPRGMAADSIVAYISYTDDQYGFTYMKMSGYRYTGFPEDR